MIDEQVLSYFLESHDKWLEKGFWRSIWFDVMLRAAIFESLTEPYCKY